MGPVNSRLGLLLLPLALPLLGCPYEAPFEPQGRALHLDSALVGSWACGSDGKGGVPMKLGYSDPSTYSLIFTRPPDVPAEHSDPGVISLWAKPMRVAGAPLWILGIVEPSDWGGPYLAFVVASRRQLRLRMVDEALMPKTPRSPAELAEAIGRVKGPGLPADWLDCTRER